MEKLKDRIERDYIGFLKELLEYELEGGEELLDGMSVDEAVLSFMHNDNTTTIFDLREYLK